MGIWWALQRGYQGIITIDGNNKDSIEDIPHFIEKLKAGYDLVQGSRLSPHGQIRQKLIGHENIPQGLHPFILQIPDRIRPVRKTVLRTFLIS